MLRILRNSIFILFTLIICVSLLALIYKIERLEEQNGRLRQNYEKVCTVNGAWNCE